MPPKTTFKEAASKVAKQSAALSQNKLLGSLQPAVQIDYARKICYIFNAAKDSINLSELDETDPIGDKFKSELRKERKIAFSGGEVIAIGKWLMLPSDTHDHDDLVATWNKEWENLPEDEKEAKKEFLQDKSGGDIANA